MNCVICLTAPNADSVCGCSALVCRACLLSLLDHGRERCVVCGSRFTPSAVVQACLLGLEGPVGQDAKAYIKLAVAYSSAGDPRCALRSLAIAQHLAVSGSRWELLIKIETAQSLLAIGHVDDADACLRGVVPMIREMPRTFGNGILFASCCTLLCKTSMQQAKFGPARAWLRRALNIQADLGLNASLATSLELDAKLLSRQGKYDLAKRTLQTAEDIMSEAESDEVLKGNASADRKCRDPLRRARSSASQTLPCDPNASKTTARPFRHRSLAHCCLCVVSHRESLAPNSQKDVD